MRPPRSNSRDLNDILDRGGPEELKTVLRDALWKTGGDPAAAGRLLDVSRWTIWEYMKLVGMQGEPKIIRNALKARYRVGDGRARAAEG